MPKFDKETFYKLKVNSRLDGENMPVTTMEGPRVFDALYFCFWCEKIHTQNKALGWWDEPRTVFDHVALFNSEPAEATEALRAGNANDNHLKHYPGFIVELADTAIRIMDFFGSLELHKRPEFINDACFDLGVIDVHHLEVGSMSRTQMICEIHFHIMQFYRCYERLGQRWQGYAYLFLALKECFQFSLALGYDLMKVIDEKVNYNLKRLDHKPGNRKGVKDF